jgi:hypothetical protein
MVGLTKDSDYVSGYRVRFTFGINLHSRYLDILKVIQLHFGGVGSFYFSKAKDAVQYRVSSVKDLLVILDHFYNYPFIRLRYFVTKKG